MCLLLKHIFIIFNIPVFITFKIKSSLLFNSFENNRPFATSDHMVLLMLFW